MREEYAEIVGARLANTKTNIKTNTKAKIKTKTETMPAQFSPCQDCLKTIAKNDRYLRGGVGWGGRVSGGVIGLGLG